MRPALSFLAFCMAACLLIFSCSGKASLYISGEGPRSGEMQTLFSLLEKHGPGGGAPDELARFARSFRDNSSRRMRRRVRASSGWLLHRLASRKDS